MHAGAGGRAARPARRQGGRDAAGGRRRRGERGGGRPHRSGGRARPGVSARLRAAESSALGARDTQVVAASLLEHALAPLGATAVAVWEAEPGGALALAGQAGFGDEEARRWRHIPPGVPTPASRTLRERRLLWHPSTTLPAIGHPPPSHPPPGSSPASDDRPAGGPPLDEHEGGARVTVPMVVKGRVVGVLEVCWPYAVPARSVRVERQIEALAELCARTLDSPYVARPEDEATGAAQHAELVGLADALPDPSLVLRARLDERRKPADFEIQHVSERVMRGDGVLLEAYPIHVGGSLLEACPQAARGLLGLLEQVHATGEPFRAERMPLQLSATGVADVSLTRHGESVLMVWRDHDEDARLAGLLEHAQRLGRIGGFEENARTGEITWNAQLYTLYGRTQGDRPVPPSNGCATTPTPTTRWRWAGSCARCCTTAGWRPSRSGCGAPAVWPGTCGWWPSRSSARTAG
ncbi:GAF domain-containing protein [Nonomuraea salmonea]|uniref:GAF domain-containing protein n=1 Tax=Nonomuraea salmonea TaxID=46181 RepID=UPI0031ED8AC8